jgi:LacI family transcriptional regulator
MRTKNLTIQDIAKKAKVGTATVSRVLNGSGNVSEETRARVLSVIESLNYRPNFSARYIRTKRSHSIGFITDTIASTPFAGNMIRGAQDSAWEYNSILLIVDSNGEPSIEENAVQMMLDRGVDGIIYATMFHRPVELPPRLREVPVVLLDCFIHDRLLASVVPDEVSAGRMAAEILLDKGHRRIAFINLPVPDIPASIGRLQGFREALEARGLFDPALTAYADGVNEMGFHGYGSTLEIMRLPDPPTAIFCGNDRIASRVCNALRDLGLSIPRDVAVLGFDNHEMVAESVSPALSTIQLPHYEMGQWAIRHLLEHGKGVPPTQQLMPCPYVPRQSV